MSLSIVYVYLYGLFGNEFDVWRFVYGLEMCKKRVVVVYR